jgi:GPH family glycoside/pentoside/hexuronide:cation symporter
VAARRGGASTVTGRRDGALSTWVLLGWSAGALSSSMSINVFGFFLLPFMTSRLGMAAALAGSIIAVNKILGLALDPLVGWLSDRAKTRLGRRRPFILAGSIILPASLLMLFLPPAFVDTPWRQTLYFTVAVLSFGVAYSVLRIPYLTMSAEMTSDPFTRARMIAFKIFAIAVGTLIGMSLAPSLIDIFGGGRAGYGKTMVILALVALAAGLTCFFATSKARFTERVVVTGRRKLDDLKTLVGNVPFAALVGAKLIFIFGVTFQASCSIYFVMFVMREPVGVLSPYYLVLTLATVASQPLWLRVVRARGKRVTFMAATMLYAVAILGWLWVAAMPGLWPLLTTAALVGMAGSGGTLALESTLPDIMELDTRRTGLRREGIFASVFSLVEKLTSAVALVCLGFFLDSEGFVHATEDVAQPYSAIVAIALAISIVPSATAILSVLVIQRWGLRDSEVLVAQGGARDPSPATAAAL